jgi:hypothetical protein
MKSVSELAPTSCHPSIAEKFCNTTARSDACHGKVTTSNPTRDALRGARADINNAPTGTTKSEVLAKSMRSTN